MQNGPVILENTWQFLRNMYLPYDPATSLLRYLSKINENSHTYSYPKSGKTPTSFKWMTKIWCSKNVSTTDTCKNTVSFNNIMITKRKETRKSVYYVISSVGHSGKGKTIMIECRSVGDRAQGQARGLTALGSLTPSFQWRPFRGLGLGKGQHGSDILIFATGWRVKRRCDQDNTEPLNPARSKFRSIPKGPVNPLCYLSLTELWLSLVTRSDPTDLISSTRQDNVPSTPAVQCFCHLPEREIPSASP